MSSSPEKISGHFGSYGVTGTSAVEIQANSLQINEVCAITELYHAHEPTINVAGATYTSTGGDTERGYNLVGMSLSVGMVIMVQGDFIFSKVKLASGSVITQ